ncbi:hypothetical protein FQR65_LT16026 [Abscondita terminalis]|nr:hypothetical protein FQR65_LT16026 [Abscondita terminalis]
MNIDIAPTLLEMQGVRIPKEIQGKIVLFCTERCEEAFQKIQLLSLLLRNGTHAVSPHFGVSDVNTSLSDSIKGRILELYDLEKDHMDEQYIRRQVIDAIIGRMKKKLLAEKQAASYTTGIVGKWHLGLGEHVEKDWNGKIAPGPLEVGYDYSFIFPATADRVPTVFLENHYVLAADAKDPIQVNYRQKIGNEPTGKENPELLKLHASPGQGHDNTIVNGIGRIGWMTGGKDARWAD